MFCPCRRCMKRNMQVFRSALAVCVITDLENVESYMIPWNRNHRVREEISLNMDRRQYVSNAMLNHSNDIFEAQNFRRQQYANWVVWLFFFFYQMWNERNQEEENLTKTFFFFDFFRDFVDFVKTLCFNTFYTQYQSARSAFKFPTGVMSIKYIYRHCKTDYIFNDTLTFASSWNPRAGRHDS